jgi:methylase of polypeptide subunit release factors
MPERPSDLALRELLRRLDDAGYDFVTPTPETHRRVLRRPSMARASGLRDIFGWSAPFAAEDVDPWVVELLDASKALGRTRGMLRSRVRVSRVAGRLYLHSAYPTRGARAVFLGPDTYRFASLLAQELDGFAPATILDVGTGAGVGGLAAADLCPGARLILSDVNDEALRYAAINLAHAGVQADCVRTSGLDGLDGPFDLVVTNPPYMGAPTGRLYRDGGDMHGARLSLDWAIAAMARLAPGGRLVLYTGSAIVGGRDRLCEALEQQAVKAGCGLRYRELDPDVFGETVSEPGYEDVDRIAAIGAVAIRGS